MVHFGIMVGSSVPLQRIAEMAKEIETRGFDSIWTIDGAYGWDAFQLANLVAQATSTIPIRTGVLNPYDRHPVKTALGAQTTQTVAKGRFGIMVGGGSLETLKSMGHDWIHPAKHVREMITIMKQLWTGERIEFDGDTTIARGCKLWNEFPFSTPVYIGCQRPWMLRLSGEVAQGVLINHGTPEHLPWSIARLNEGASRVGRDLKKGGFETLNLCTGTVAEDRATAYEWSRPSMPYVFMNLDEWHMKDAGITPADYEAVRKPLVVQTQESLQQSADAVEDWMLKKFTIAGTPEETVRILKNYFATGIDGVVLSVPSKPEGRAEKCLQLLSEHVVPAFR